MIGLVRVADHAVEKALLALPVAPVLALGNNDSGAVEKVPERRVEVTPLASFFVVFGDRYVPELPSDQDLRLI